LKQGRIHISSPLLSNYLDNDAPDKRFVEYPN
jgi:hypothetical protein